LKNTQKIDNNKLKSVKDTKNIVNFENVDKIIQHKIKRNELEDIQKSIIKDQIKAIDTVKLN